MQGVLWLIFLATLGLAGLVNHQVRKTLLVPLGESIQLDPIELRLPAGWEINGVNDIDSRGVRALEPAQFGRRLEVRLYRVTEAMSAKEFLAHFHAQIPGRSGHDSSIVIAGQPGALVAGTIDHPVPGGMLRQKYLIAAAMLPDGFTIKIDLIGHNDIDPTDIALINDVAASITIPQPASAEAQASVLDLP